MYYFIYRSTGSSVYSAVTEILEKSGYWQCKNPDSSKFHLVFGERNRLSFARLGHEPGFTQAVNYFNGNDSICKKSSLVCTLKDYAKKCERNFDWILPAYVVNPEKIRKEIKFHSKRLKENLKSPWMEFYLEKPVRDFREDLRRASATLASGNQRIWIAKPNTGCKGEGIMISDDIDQLIQFVDNSNQSHVIQKYVENPMLLTGERKFDIRCWVLLDHKYDIYLYREGVVRTASDAYDPSNLDKVTSHLTNHCLQQQLADKFGEYEEGNEMFYEEFNRFLEAKYNLSLESDILPQIRRIIKDCFAAGKEKMDASGLSYKSFQLFGFDFIIDDKGHVYLLEINGAPACAECARQLPSFGCGVEYV
ncbi:uncharacterized protein TRIADDRAFT_52733 [Trichoplax adhaerens]|uniref:Tubulin--tyrosine ligase n=1 Tax=Trichoplax adhaerens TaxID=10228 RepID=B3RK66_TRIAD|nr:hypothetical protein TRIADDRAFT_52733 [Trichoplax adhaerens]EDV29149.1 hypothetical protein TRIADDRAFT_52733 [Trichoplax adhaerens]|eukprot:XP_002108351.1 hypothetical protein TRIADDRAFT_52733 [Trichoplax adhaerens]